MARLFILDDACSANKILVGFDVEERKPRSPERSGESSARTDLEPLWLLIVLIKG
jgi:hypothetical protein